MWVRGLKQRQRLVGITQGRVAPYVGAWIETDIALRLSIDKDVAPYVGAWIETAAVSLYWSQRRVAPYVGAWIETW